MKEPVLPMPLVVLRRTWWQTAVAWTLVWAGLWLGLRPLWPYTTSAALFSALPLAYSLWVLWRNLPENHRAGETAVLPTLGPGNQLTLLRGLTIGLVAGFLFAPQPPGVAAWLPMILYTFADVADYFDGYLARRANHATLLGGRLDMEFDGLGMLIVSVLGVWYGRLPLLYLALGVARYLFVFGLWLRRRQNWPVYDMPESIHRRNFAGFQMGFMSVVLWPVISPAGTRIAGLILGLATAVSFGRDWLMVCGWLRPNQPRYQMGRAWLYTFTTRTFPLLLRLTLAISLPLLASHEYPLASSAWRVLFDGWGWPGAWAAAILSLILLVAGLTAVLGILPRTACLLLMYPLNFDAVARGMTVATAVALAAATAILLLGSGRYSAWTPEEAYMVRRAGE